MVDYRPRDTLTEAAGGDWKRKSKDINIDFMVDYLPLDTLPEGRGW
jgi:hypothetical protein